MVTLDNTCREIVAKYLRDNHSLGKQMYQWYKDNKSSKVEYLEALYNLVDAICMDDSPSTAIENMFEKQEYFEFNPNKQVQKITDKVTASFMVTPCIIKRIDAEGNIHYMCVPKAEQGDIFIKYLPFHPQQFQDLLRALDVAEYKSCGFNLFNTQDEPTIFIYGKTMKNCTDLKKELCESFHINLKEVM